VPGASSQLDSARQLLRAEVGPQAQGRGCVELFSRTAPHAATARRLLCVRRPERRLLRVWRLEEDTADELATLSPRQGESRGAAGLRLSCVLTGWPTRLGSSGLDTRQRVPLLGGTTALGRGPGSWCVLAAACWTRPRTLVCFGGGLIVSRNFTVFVESDRPLIGRNRGLLARTLISTSTFEWRTARC
jgi:hypothetical protein